MHRQAVAYNDDAGKDPEPAPELVEPGPVTEEELQLAVAAEGLEALASGEDAIRENIAADLVGRTITLVGEPIDLMVPEAGLIASVHTLGADGYVPADLDICNPGDGTLTVEISEEAVVEPSDLTFSATPCTQLGNSFTPSQIQTGTVNWYYNNTGGQTHITTSEFASIVKTGFDGMLTGRNDCGFGDPISLNAARVGSTTAGTGGTSDGQNTMGWGFVSTSGLARAYQWSNGSRMTEFDIRFTINEVDKKLAESIGSTCGHSYHFAGVALHEVMHGYGFEHTSSNLQTMYTSMSRCDTNWYTMGKGDWEGVSARY